MIDRGAAPEKQRRRRKDQKIKITSLIAPQAQRERGGEKGPVFRSWHLEGCVCVCVCEGVIKQDWGWQLCWKDQAHLEKACVCVCVCVCKAMCSCMHSVALRRCSHTEFQGCNKESV